MTPPGIEPATFRSVAQYLNHCATMVPKHYWTGGGGQFTWDHIVTTPKEDYMYCVGGHNKTDR